MKSDLALLPSDRTDTAPDNRNPGVFTKMLQDIAAKPAFWLRLVSFTPANQWADCLPRLKWTAPDTAQPAATLGITAGDVLAQSTAV